MERSSEFSVLLFSYGTLQDKAVQLSNFGRELVGQQDAMLGFSTSWVEITDTEVLTASGKTHHPIVSPSGRNEDSVEGMVFQITEQELAAADAYEVSDYKRAGLHATAPGPRHRGCRSASPRPAREGGPSAAARVSCTTQPAFSSSSSQLQFKGEPPPGVSPGTWPRPGHWRRV